MELQGGTSDVSFHWQVVASRANVVHPTGPNGALRTSAFRRTQGPQDREGASGHALRTDQVRDPVVEAAEPASRPRSHQGDTVLSRRSPRPPGPGRRGPATGRARWWTLRVMPCMEQGTCRGRFTVSGFLCGHDRIRASGGFAQGPAAHGDLRHGDAGGPDVRRGAAVGHRGQRAAGDARKRAGGARALRVWLLRRMGLHRVVHDGIPAAAVGGGPARALCPQLLRPHRPVEHPAHLPGHPAAGRAELHGHPHPAAAPRVPGAEAGALHQRGRHAGQGLAASRRKILVFLLAVISLAHRVRHAHVPGRDA